MKKIILLILAAWLPLSAIAAGKPKINPLQINNILKQRGGFDAALHRVRTNLSLLTDRKRFSPLGSSPLEIHNASVLLQDLIPLGHITSQDVLPLIEDSYKLFRDKPEGAYFGELAVDVALRHGEFDFLNRFILEQELGGDFYQAAYRVAAYKYEALAVFPNVLYSAESIPLSERMISYAKNGMVGNGIKDPLLLMMDQFTEESIYAWLPVKGTPEDEALNVLAREQKERPRYHIEQTENVLKMLENTLEKAENTTDQEFLCVYYENEYWPASHKDKVTQAFLDRYESINQTIISELKRHIANLQDYLEHPQQFSSGDMERLASQLRGEVYAVKAQLVAFIQYNMDGGTPLQHDLYEALSRLAEYYRFLQPRSVKIPQKYQEKYGFSEDVHPHWIGRPRQTSNWADPLLLSNRPHDYKLKNKNATEYSEEQVRAQATELSQMLREKNPFLPSKEKNIVSQGDFDFVRASITDPSAFWIGMLPPTNQEKSVLAERGWVEQFYAFAYARELLCQNQLLIELDATGDYPLLSAAHAQQLYNKARMAEDWLVNGIRPKLESPLNRTQYPELRDLLRQVANYWNSVENLKK